jgi:hypothetical protein
VKEVSRRRAPRTWRSFHCSASHISAGDAMASSASLQRRGFQKNEINSTETKKQPAKIAESQAARRGMNRIDARYEQAGNRSVRRRKREQEKRKETRRRFWGKENRKRICYSLPVDFVLPCPLVRLRSSGQGRGRWWYTPRPLNWIFG